MKLNKWIYGVFGVILIITSMNSYSFSMGDYFKEEQKLTKEEKEEIDYKKVKKGAEGFKPFLINLWKKIEHREDRQELKFKKIGEYILSFNYNSKELLELENELSKKKDEYNKFGAELLNNFIRYRWERKFPKLSKIDIIIEKILPVISNPKYDDDMRARYVGKIHYILTSFFNQGIPIDKVKREEIMDVLIKLLKNKKNNSKLRSTVAFAIASEGEDENSLQAVLEAFEDEDENVRSKVKRGIYFNNKFENDKRIQEKLNKK
ncbi:MAG: HEAT repeat domain-containing protein [bacterium]|nr:HEAT repeat domain-containing protein [bacterium]